MITNSRVVSAMLDARRKAGQFVYEKSPRARLRMQRRLIKQSGLYDQAWVQQQLPADHAFVTIDDYLQQKLYLVGISPNPLLEPAIASTDLFEEEPISAYLTGQTRNPHPLFDAGLYQFRNPESANHPGRAIGHFQSSAATDSLLPTRWLPPDQWLNYGQLLNATADVRERSTHTDISVIVSAVGDSAAAIRSVTELAQASARSNLNIAVVAPALNMSEYRVFAALALVSPNIYIVNLADAQPAIADGETTVVIRRGVRITNSALTSVSDELAQTQAGALCPLAVGSSDLILDHGWGASGYGELPYPMQRGLPCIDRLPAGVECLALGDQIAVLTRSTIEESGLSVNELISFDNIAISNTLRKHNVSLMTSQMSAQQTSETETGLTPPQLRKSAEENLRHSVTANVSMTPTLPTSVTGITATHIKKPAISADSVALPVATYHRAPSERLRICIRVAAPSGVIGDRWGDVSFAHDLAAGFQEAGHAAFVERIDQQHRPGSELDVVSIVIRGLNRLQPRPNVTNILWVISHPDLVSTDELNSFDLVYVASTQWAHVLNRKHDLNIKQLLQATNPHRFSPTAIADSGDVVFVGSSRSQLRPAVADAIAAEAAVKVFGTGWHGLIDAKYIAADFIDPEHVSNLYSQAHAVLNDQWEDMAREGFIANRIFDVLAAGGVAISTPVSGLEDVFADRVSTYRSVEELAALLSNPVLRSIEQREADAQWVRTHHSFKQRAESIIADLLAARSLDGLSQL